MPANNLEETLTVQRILQDALDELERADIKHGPMQEMVEGLYTLKCEVMELEREIKRKNFNKKEMRREACQVLAMAIKFARDCC